MPKITVYITYIFLIIASACEKDVSTVKLPEFVPKLVIASFIAPGDTLSYIQVISSTNLYGELNSDNSPGKLTGVISDGITEIILDTAKNGLTFSNDKMQVDYGKTYKITVLSDKGLSAEATCTVPDKGNFDLKTDTFSIPWEIPGYRPWREFKINITFTDQPEKENYYRLTGKYIGYHTDQDNQELLINNEFIWFEKGLMTDEAADVNGKIQITSGLNQSLSYYDSTFLKIYLLNTEKSYYQYHKSLEDYSDDENPFTESTPVYSNITGGLGIFAAYTIDSLVFRLK